jgi:dTDP-4-dehydrorhamnose 3,5-epimerase-like enzyme
MDITTMKPAFEDQRGSIWDFLTDETIHHIGLLITKKDTIRGKHFHKEQKQYTLVLNGKIRVTAKNLNNTNSELEVKELKKMDMVFFPPYMYHSVEALEDSECLIFTSKSRKDSGYEDDTFRVEDINSFTL